MNGTGQMFHYPTVSFDPTSRRGKWFRDVSLIVLGGALALLPGTALDLVFAVSDSEVAADAYLISAGHLLSILGVVYLAVRAALRHQLDVIGLTTVIALMTIVRLTALGS